VPAAELERTYNQGVGMVALVSAETADAALRRLGERGVQAWVCGEARTRGQGELGDAAPKGGAGGAVSLVGSYA
jgi:phosphoribosylformylglycinamidine cyclo-ligase